MTMSEPDAPEEETPTSSSHGGITGVMSGIVISGGKAAKKISSPLEKAIRYPMLKVSSLHGKDRSATCKEGGDDASVTSTSSGDGTSLLNRAAEKSRHGCEKALKTLSSPMKRITSGSKHKPESRGEEEEGDVVENSDLPAVPPDGTLQKMDIIVNKLLKGVSIPEFYEVVWSEGNKTNREPLLGPWLEENGKREITVGDWEFADEAGEFVGKWCGEKYKQKRTVNFVFNKNIPLRAGPTIAKVQNTEYCRVEGNDKCVMQRTVQMEGIPFSDSFNVEVRWVATRSGKNDIALQVGLFVNFVKSTMVAGKIRAGTTEETTNSQLSLFMKIKEACGATSEEIVEEPKEVEETEHFSCATFIDRFAFWRRHDVLANRDDDIAVSVRSADKKLKQVIEGLEASELSDIDTVIRDQLLVVNMALDKILTSTKS